MDSMKKVLKMINILKEIDNLKRSINGKVEIPKTIIDNNESLEYEFEFPEISLNKIHFDRELNVVTEKVTLQNARILLWVYPNNIVILIKSNKNYEDEYSFLKEDDLMLDSSTNPRLITLYRFINFIENNSELLDILIRRLEKAKY